MNNHTLTSRPAWLRLFVLSSDQDLENMVRTTQLEQRCQSVLEPQVGIVTVRARISGRGAQFNVGDACVTKAEVLLDNQIKGYATVLGGRARRAKLVAMLDAAMAANIGGHLHALVQQLADKYVQRNAQRQQAAGKTKVDFFTMVRGD